MSVGRAGMNQLEFKRCLLLGQETRLCIAEIGGAEGAAIAAPRKYAGVPHARRSDENTYFNVIGGKAPQSAKSNGCAQSISKLSAEEALILAAGIE